MTDATATTPRPHPVPGPPGLARRTWGRVFAALYEPVMKPTERGGMAARRAALLAEATGTVVELGAGTGLNLAQYPPGLDLVLTEPEPPMARRLRERAAREGVAARILEAPAERLPVPDASADTVVATLVLCTVRDVGRTLAEIRRVLRPDGRLLFIEHVAAHPGTRLRRWQDRLERPWRAVAHGCMTNRDTERALREHGFEIERIEHGEMEGEVLIKPLIWGRARPV